ncbi:hypothetical protein LWI29_025133 [Acer saccharum]|uniref:Reverse transcriptase Ty1/copia-type domain-containing protein n=1 Tax=Acer saccharum TaxID=4024 RepID=A0AA39SVF3_ACESA|nr:hypothetical protein LWI29_025133 [Acer saccharum]
MKQPEGFICSVHPNHVCHLLKSFYGLKQAPQAWFEKLKSALVQWGFQSSVSDHSLIILRRNKDVTLLLVYVDDILVIGTDPTLAYNRLSRLQIDRFALKTQYTNSDYPTLDDRQPTSGTVFFLDQTY